jgi:hypothetical protein
MVETYQDFHYLEERQPLGLIELTELDGSVEYLKLCYLFTDVRQLCYLILETFRRIFRPFVDIVLRALSRRDLVAELAEKGSSHFIDDAAIGWSFISFCFLGINHFQSLFHKEGESFQQRNSGDDELFLSSFV